MSKVGKKPAKGGGTSYKECRELVSVSKARIAQDVKNMRSHMHGLATNQIDQLYAVAEGIANAYLAARTERQGQQQVTQYDQLYIQVRPGRNGVRAIWRRTFLNPKNENKRGTIGIPKGQTHHYPKARLERLAERWMQDVVTECEAELAGVREQIDLWVKTRRRNEAALGRIVELLEMTETNRERS